MSLRKINPLWFIFDKKYKDLKITITLLALFPAMFFGLAFFHTSLIACFILAVHLIFNMHTQNRLQQNIRHKQQLILISPPNKTKSDSITVITSKKTLHAVGNAFSKVTSNNIFQIVNPTETTKTYSLSRRSSHCLQISCW